MAFHFETTYKINGIALPFPASGQWMPRDPIGTDGNNIKVYPAVRSFTLTWTNLFPSEWLLVYGFWQAVMASGAVTVSLPPLVPTMPGVPDDLGAEVDAYESFVAYTGCVIDEPTVGPFDTRTYANVQMLIRNIVA